MNRGAGSMSPLEAAKEFYTIAVLAREIYPDWREPRRPGESGKAPYREDKHPSFSIVPGTGGRLCHDFSEGKQMGPVELVARVFNIPPQPDACRLLVEMYQAHCGAGGELLSPPPPVVEAERNCVRGQPKLPFLAEGSRAERLALAKLRHVSEEAVDCLVERGIIRFCYHLRQRCWVITDSTRRAAGSVSSPHPHFESSGKSPARCRCWTVARLR
jgi:hypothetical protein